jgi:hypothetical protein
MGKNVTRKQPQKINKTKMRKRATMLAGSIRQAKTLGIVVSPLEPIEGKMFWSESES